MTDHPLTETAAAELWDAHAPAYLGQWHSMSDSRRAHAVSLLRAGFNAAREHYTADDMRDTPAGQALMAEAKREVAYGLECIATGHDWTGNEEAARCCRATAKALLHAFPKEGNR